MLFFFIMFMFVLLHIQFLLRNVLFGTYDTSYFQFTTVYLFDRDMAIESLWFSIGSAVFFAVPYLWAYRNGARHAALSPGADKIAGFQATAIGGGGDDLALTRNLATASKIFLVVGLLQTLANLILAADANFVYQTMAETLERSGFIFELRFFLLAALAFIALNVRPATFWRGREYRFVRLVLALYTFSILVVQARSRVFEIGALLVYAYLMWAGDRVRWRYLAVLAATLLVPNLIVLGRLGVPSDPRVLINGLFSFEYSITLNNFLGAAIERSYFTQGDLTFLKSLWLLIPSPIRTFLNIEVVKSDAYEALAGIAEVRNGGYSMVAEMFQNFGWYGMIAFGVMGLGLGALNRRASQVGQVSMVMAAAPLIYVAFVIAFRNDFGVFIKFVVQAFIVTGVLRIMMHSQTRTDIAPRPVGLPPQSAATDQHP